MSSNSTGITGNPYAGGNVVLNNTPFVQFYTNMLARQQAQKDAFAKSMQEQAKSLTPAGMRSIDTDALMQAKNDWQSHWQQNKDAIQHPDIDNGKAWSENNDLYNKAASKIAQSKEAAKTDQALLKLSLDPKRAALLADDARQLIHKHQLPINDSNHKTLTLDDLDSPLFNKRQPTLQEQIALDNFTNSKHLGQEVDRKKGSTDPNTFMRNDTVTYMPTEGEKQEIHDLAERLYKSNDPNMSAVDKIVEEHNTGINNPKYDQLNNIFKKYYNKNIEHPEEAATAVLMGMNRNYGDKIVPTKDLATEAATKRMQQFEEHKQTRKYDVEHPLRDSNNQYDPQAHIAAIWDNRDTSPSALTSIHVGGQEIKGAPVSLPPEVSAKIVRKGFGNTQIKPTAFFMSEDKKNVYPVYETGETTKSGNPYLEAKPEERIPVSTGLIPDLGKAFGGLPYTRKSLQFNQPKKQNTYNINGQDFNEGELLKNGWTPEAIQKGIKTGKIKQKASDGLTSKAGIKQTSSWHLSEDIQGASHDDGGVDVTANGQPVNAEGNELKIKNEDGKEAIIPKRWRDRVLKLLKIGDNKKLSTIVQNLPKQPNVAEDGGIYGNDESKKLDPQIQEKITYISSPDYKQRLISMGEKNPDKLIQDRINLIKNTVIAPTQMGQAQTTTITDTAGKQVPAVVLAKGDTDVVKAHELGHVTGGGKDTKDVYDPFEGEPNQMSPAESWAFINRNKSLTPEQKKMYWEKYHNPNYKGDSTLMHKYSMDVPADTERGDTHDISTSENKSDLDALRYLFQKAGITKKYGENITPDLLDKAANHPQIKNEPHFQRMMKNFGKNGILQLNNMIAMQSGKQLDNLA